MAKKLENPTDLLILIAEVLNDLRIDFFVGGGFAVAVWGRPRFTADIDLVINLEEKKIPELAIQLRRKLPDAYIEVSQMPEALERFGEFNIIEPSLGIKVDFWILKNEEYDKLALRRSVKKDIGRNVRFTTPEDLIISKLKWHKLDGSSRHFEDIKSIFEMSKIDVRYVKTWVKKLGLLAEYKKYLKKSGV